MTTVQIPASLLEDRGYATTVKVRFQFPERAAHSDYEMGLSPEGRSARKVFQGPLTEGLFGWMNECATVIGLHHIPDSRPLVTLHDGDEIVVEGHGTFVVEPITFQRPRREVQLAVKQ